jgi:pheromone shutdown protein TraB
MRDHPEKTIVAVVGAGHEKELVQLVKAELS